MKDGSSTHGDSPLVARDAVLRGRRSVRSYRAEAVPRPLVETVLAAAACAPSPHHSAPWRFVVLTEPAARRRRGDARGNAPPRDLGGDGLDGERIGRLVDRSRERLLAAPVL